MKLLSHTFSFVAAWFPCLLATACFAALVLSGHVIEVDYVGSGSHWLFMVTKGTAFLEFTALTSHDYDTGFRWLAGEYPELPLPLAEVLDPVSATRRAIQMTFFSSAWVGGLVWSGLEMALWITNRSVARLFVWVWRRWAHYFGFTRARWRVAVPVVLLFNVAVAWAAIRTAR